MKIFKQSFRNIDNKQIYFPQKVHPIYRNSPLPPPKKKNLLTKKPILTKITI